MKIFDFNIHFSLLGNVDNPHLVSDETRMNLEDLLFSFNKQIEIFKDNFRVANFMLFNEGLFSHGQDIRPFLKHVQVSLPGSYFSALFDFRNPHVSDDMENAAAQGVNGLKFHSYFQKISDEDFSAALELATRAQALGMFICIDTSYGTSGMYHYDNMKLACMLSDELTCPIILLHSGGMRILEAMLLVHEKEHVFLETSFTLPFYKGSSIDQDIQYAYSKIGSKRIIYGSDHPYIDMKRSLEVTLDYLEKCNFSANEIEDIMYGNAKIIKSL